MDVLRGPKFVPNSAPRARFGGRAKESGRVAENRRFFGEEWTLVVHCGVSGGGRHAREDRNSFRIPLRAQGMVDVPRRADA